MSRALGGSCQVPVRGFCGRIIDGVFGCVDLLRSQDGTCLISDESRGEPELGAAIGLSWPESESSWSGRNLGALGSRGAETVKPSVTNALGESMSSSRVRDIRRKNCRKKSVRKAATRSCFRSGNPGCQRFAAFANLIDRLQEFDLAVFVSANAVSKAMSRIVAKLRPKHCHGIENSSEFGLRHGESAKKFGVETVSRLRHVLTAKPCWIWQNDTGGWQAYRYFPRRKADGVAGRDAEEARRHLEYVSCYRRVRPDQTPPNH